MSDEQAELAAAHARIAALEELERAAFNSGYCYGVEDYASSEDLNAAWELHCRDRRATLLSSASGGEGEDKVVSYLYRNPDSGWEVSVNHPVDSGEVPDAEYIEPISGTVHNLLTEAWASPTPAQAEDVVEQVSALAKFTEYFRKNYPGPDTIIYNPDWHAPRIFRAALSALPLDRNRIREIRERHAERERLISVSILPPSDANADVGFLLQQIGNLGDENGD